MSAGAGFGSFMKGLAGGVETGQGIRRERQLDRLYDAGIRRLENEEKAQALDLEAEGEDPGLLSSFSLGDPFIDKLMGFFQNKKAKPTVSALPITGSPEQTLSAQTIGMPEEEEHGFADGGEVEKEEERKREQARVQRYNATPRQVVQGAGEVSGALASSGPRGARGLLHGAADIVDKGTDDPIDGGGRGRTMAFLENVIDTPRVAAAGALRGLGDMIPGGGGPAGAAQAPVAAPGAAPYNPSRNAGPALHNVPAQTGRASQQAAVRATGGGAIPRGPAKPAAEAPMDFSGVDPMEVPDYKTRDWVEFRKSAVKSAILRGMPRADAVDKVDQQVIGMQMRGFQNFAAQGMALQQAGDLKAAAAAYRAAFQYMPTTSDVKFSIVKGNLVAYAVDEETGQPESRPWLVNPDTLSSMAKNFSSPGAWAEHAMDRERIGVAQDEIALRERRLDEHEIPHGRAMARASQTSAEASMLNATAANRRALNTGDDAPSASENLAGDKDVRELVMEAAMAAGEDDESVYPELQDQRVRDRLIADITEVRRRRPDMSSDMILKQILQRAQSGE